MPLFETNRLVSLETLIPDLPDRLSFRLLSYDPRYSNNSAFPTPHGFRGLCRQTAGSSATSDGSFVDAGAERTVPATEVVPVLMDRPWQPRVVRGKIGGTLDKNPEVLYNWLTC